MRPMQSDVKANAVSRSALTVLAMTGCSSETSLLRNGACQTGGPISALVSDASGRWLTDDSSVLRRDSVKDSVELIE